jgi:hypothetical protein
MLRSEREKLQQVATVYALNTLLYAQECISEAEKQVKFNTVFPQCIELLAAKIRKENK